MTPWKHELKQAYAPPPPQRKREFLRSRQTPLSVLQLLSNQVGYIQKWVWLASALVCLIATIAALTKPTNILSLLSACTPLLALTIVSESQRSERHGMAELETATRFSLQSVVLARLIILGLSNLLLLGILMVPCCRGTVPPLTVATYLAVPFLLNSYLCLLISRTVRGDDSLFCCVGTTVCISLFLLLSPHLTAFIYAERHLIWWTAALVGLCMGIGQQAKFIIKQREELAWS